MRTLLTLLFVTVGFGAVAQSSSYSKHINSDGQRLHIRIDRRDPIRPMYYDRSFDVSSLSQKEVEALEKRVLDSLYTATETVIVASNAQIPYQKTVDENLPEGRLKIRFSFVIDGLENSVERTAIIRDASERGLQKLREAIEQQLTAEMDALTRKISQV